MYGCEEPPADPPILVDVVLEGADGTRRVLPYPDEALRRGGVWPGYVLGIAEDGTWLYFISGSG